MRLNGGAWKHFFMIRSATITDAPQICGIYNPFVEGTVITFEEKAVSVPAMAERIAAASTLPWSRQ